MNNEEHKTCFEMFIKSLNDNGLKAEITSNEVIDGIHHASYTFHPKYPIDNITLHYTIDEYGNVKFKEN